MGRGNRVGPFCVRKIGGAVTSRGSGQRLARVWSGHGVSGPVDGLSGDEDDLRIICRSTALLVEECHLSQNKEMFKGNCKIHSKLH